MSDLKKKLDAKLHLVNQGINPEEIAREQRPELMVCKLALVGVFNTLETFCIAGKNNVMSSIGPLNTRALGMFIGALKRSLELGEGILANYQNVQNTIIEEEIATANELEQLVIETTQIEEDVKAGQHQPENNNETQTEEDESTSQQVELAKIFDIRKLN